MTSQWSALTNQRPLFHTRYFCYTIEKFHGTFHTCMNSYVEDFRVSRNISYVYEFIRRRLHTRIKSNAFETIRVCKIPWMILHNDTRIKSYTYEKLHVWKVTRMKNYTYEKLHVLNIELWLVHCYTRIEFFTELLIRVCFLTWNFSYVEPLPLFVHFGQPYQWPFIIECGHVGLRAPDKHLETRSWLLLSRTVPWPSFHYTY